MRVIIVGAGGHAQVVADCLLRARDKGGKFIPIGFVDDNPEFSDKSFLSLQVLGALADLASIPHDGVVVAVGNNRVRETIVARFAGEGEHFVTVIHPSAIIAPDVLIADGAMLCAGCVVNTGSVIGAHVIVNTASSIDHHNQIGAFAHVAPGVHLGGDVSVGKGSLIGIGATVINGIKIGAASVVGAGAVVIRDVEDYEMVAGVPARHLGIVRHET
ncbi:MAG: acetyltransferase [Anaerolineae bacterium]|nr:acetyltransferase [Anaerolineae bacterium]